MSEHYFSEKPTSNVSTKTIICKIKGHSFEFTTTSGTFSVERADPASLLLLESAQINEKSDILDIGCGWGLIGIVLKKIHPQISLTMTDINERAVHMAKQNAKANMVIIEVLKGDLYEPVKERKFDTILTNPPMKAGRELCYKIIEEAASHLKQNGTLQLVAMHNKGGAMLEKKMKEVFSNVETLAKQSGFHVYLSRN